MSEARVASARRVRWLALVLGGIAAGCGTLGQEQRLTDLEIALRTYGAAMRWGLYDNAASYVRLRPGSEPVPPCVPRDDVRITTYQVRDTGLSDDGYEANVRATLGYMPLDASAVREVLDVQHWWYSKDAHRWFIDGGLPEAICKRLPEGRE